MAESLTEEDQKQQVLDCISEVGEALSGRPTDHVQIALTANIVGCIIAMAPDNKNEQMDIAAGMYREVLRMLNAAEIEYIKLH